MAELSFKFKLFTSSDPDTQYNAITTKDPLTFYLLKNGKGYLGDVKLFDATETVAGVLTGKFFRAVKCHTITAEDLTNVSISLPEGTKVGDIGLLFTADNDNEDGEEQYYFVSLKDYLSQVYTFGNTDTITLSIDDSNNVTANLKVADGETGIVADSTGLHLSKVDAINEDAPTDKLVTEDKLVAYIQNTVLAAVDTAVTQTLSNVVTAENDNGGTA